MWVIKLGGSLSASAGLRDWLDGLALLGGGRVIIVPGGGGLANEVRRLQAHWHFDDLPAHNMAVLAMAQNAWLMCGLQPALQLVEREADIVRTLRLARTVVWSPLELVRRVPDANTNWAVTGDSIALDLALRLNAERLLLVKSCDIDDDDLGSLHQREVLDAGFMDRLGPVAFPIDVLNVGQWPQARGLLLGQA